jgi:hypothetical protein
MISFRLLNHLVILSFSLNRFKWKRLNLGAVKAITTPFIQLVIIDIDRLS